MGHYDTCRDGNCGVCGQTLEENGQCPHGPHWKDLPTQKITPATVPTGTVWRTWSTVKDGWRRTVPSQGFDFNASAESVAQMLASALPQDQWVGDFEFWLHGEFEKKIYSFRPRVVCSMEPHFETHGYEESED